MNPFSFVLTYHGRVGKAMSGAGRVVPEISFAFSRLTTPFRGALSVMKIPGKNLDFEGRTRVSIFK
jgi:hypothetical protein